MMSHTVKNTAHTVSVATAFAALTCSALGTGAAGAAELSAQGPLGSSSSGLAQLGSEFLGSDKPRQSGNLVEKHDEVDGLKDQLPAEEAQKVLDGRFTVKNNEALSLTFDRNGTLGYNDGCNSGTAIYHVDKNGAVVVDNLTETRMACEQQAMEDAHAFKSILTSKPVVFPVGDSAYALGSQGEVIQLVKAEDTDE